MKNRDRTRQIFVVIIAVSLLVIVSGVIWRRPPPPPSTSTVTATSESPVSATSEPPEGTIEISMWTNDTKAEWVHQVTEAFNEARFETESGRPIFVQVDQLSSGDVFPKIQAGQIEPTVWSPGETSWINDANTIWRDLNGRPLTSGPCTPIVYTAIGIGMWRPMAEAMGWPDTPIGWADIIELATDPDGWARYGHPEWGQFKFGHTHPDSSNTGLLAMISLTYSAADVTEALTPEMVKSEAVTGAFRALELNTYHYGVSTRSLFTKMAERGPAYLHAGTNSEIGVLATNFYQGDILRFPFVFIFPKEGAFWSDNPFCILDADWVTEEQREAAEIYHQYLVDKEAQETAVDEWLRPADPTIPLRPPISLDNGTDPRVTRDTVTPLESVSGDTVRAISDVFHQTKKRATVVVALDTSESMAGSKLNRAVEATRAFLQAYARDRDDEIVITIFNNEPVQLQPSGPVGEVVESLDRIMNGIFAEGNTALNDAICQAVETINEREAAADQIGESRLYGIVLLSDGRDTNSVRSESDMFGCLPSGETAEGVKIFAIAYGDDADEALLQRVANRTNGRFFDGKPEDVEEILLRILYEQ